MLRSLSFERLRSSFFFLPALMVLGAIGLSIVTLSVDASMLDPVVRLVFDGDADTARSVLSTIAASTMTFTGIVFTITVVVLQLASSQFSPRVLRTFLRDQPTQLALGILLATFTYALLILRAVNEASVPRLSVGTAIVVVIVALWVFVFYLSHIAQRIRVTSIIDAIAAETRGLIATWPEGSDGPRQTPMASVPDRTVPAQQAGVVQVIDAAQLSRQAWRDGCVYEVVVTPGQYVPRGAPLVHVHGASDRSDRHIGRYVGLGGERTAEQDVAFGFRQLVDIAQRALSPGIHDPTTAAESLARIHDLLRDLAGRSLPSGEHRDAAGELRVLTSERPWEDYVHLAVDEITAVGRDKIQIRRALEHMLEDVRDVVPPSRRAPVDVALDALRR